jgi:hypothetical protein
MSKNLNGLASADLTLNSLSLVGITATDVTASSTLSGTTLNITGDATIAGNLALGTVTDVEEQLLNSNINAGVGLTKVDGTGTNADTINFTGESIGSVNISTEGTITAGTLASGSITDVETSISNLTSSKQDSFSAGTGLSFTGSTAGGNLELIATSALNSGDAITINEETSNINFTGGNSTSSVDVNFRSGTFLQLNVQGTTASDNVVITDTNTTEAPRSHNFQILQSANAGRGLKLELTNDGAIELINNDQLNITLFTNDTIKHLLCNGSTGQTSLYFNNAEKLKTLTDGVSITGALTTTTGITGASYNQTGTDGNNFTGDTTFQGLLLYVEPGTSTTKNVAAKISTLETSVTNKQDTIDANNRLNANLINDGSVDNTEFSYLNGVSSAIQTQLDAKQDTISAGTGLTFSGTTLNCDGDFGSTSLTTAGGSVSLNKLNATNTLKMGYNDELQILQYSAGNLNINHEHSTGSVYFGFQNDFVLRRGTTGSYNKHLKCENSTGATILYHTNGNAGQTARDENGFNPGLLTSVLYLGTGNKRIHYGNSQDNGITPDLSWYGPRETGQGRAGQHVWKFASPATASTVNFLNLSGDSNCAVNAASFGSTSDDRIKSNETPITDATTTLNKLMPLLYEQYGNVEKTDASFNNAGLIAQQVYYDAPELRTMVRLNDDGNGNDIIPLELPQGDIETFNDIQEGDYETTLNWGADAVSLNYNYLIPYLIKSIQELHQRIEVLENN